MRITRLSVLPCFVALVACQSTAPPEASTAASTTETIRFGVVGDGPVIDPADYGASYLLPGATVVEAGTMHLWTVAFFADPAETPRVLHLTSTDGVTWDGDADASVLDDFALELDGVGPVPSAAFIDGDGTWVMVGGGRRAGGVQPVIWRATAPGPDGPWVAHPDPLLEPEAGGWDSAIVDHPTVLRTGDGYLMAYGGASRAFPNRNRIGFATSDDGITWTRADAHLDGADDDQALGPDACGIDARTMVEPHLLPTEAGGQLLVFGVMLEGSDTDLQLLTATSADGRTWTCTPGVEGFGSDDIPGGPGLHASAVIGVPDGPPILLVEVLGDDSSSLWLVRPD